MTSATIPRGRSSADAYETARLRTSEDVLSGAAASAVSWAAIFGGALAALATTLVLLTLGAGLGLTTVSPWQFSGVSLTTFGVLAAIWLVLVQWISSALGGYLAGRLRTKWDGVDADEVYFRDTAHGFLAWALATAVIVALVASGAASAISGGVRAASTIASGAAQGATQGGAERSAGGATDPTRYYVDTLFRSSNPSGDSSGRDVSAEAGRILVADLANGEVPPADRTYLGQLVSARTGLSQADAEKRVDDVVAQIRNAEAKTRQAADTARKTTSQIAIITALSMAIGAFVASAAGALGGSRRNEF